MMISHLLGLSLRPVTDSASIMVLTSFSSVDRSGYYYYYYYDRHHHIYYYYYLLLLLLSFFSTLSSKDPEGSKLRLKQV